MRSISHFWQRPGTVTLIRRLRSLYHNRDTWVWPIAAVGIGVIWAGFIFRSWPLVLFGLAFVCPSILAGSVAVVDLLLTLGKHPADSPPVLILEAQAIFIAPIAALLLAIAVLAGMPYAVVDVLAYLFSGSVAVLIAIGLGVIGYRFYTYALHWIDRRRRASPLAFARLVNILRRVRRLLLRLPTLILALPFYWGRWSAGLSPLQKLAVQAMVIGYVAALLLVVVVLTHLPQPLIDLLAPLVCGSIAVAAATGLSIAARRCYGRVIGSVDIHCL